MSDTTQSQPARPLEGKAALVTGASRGIGRAIAVHLAELGARVACVATRVENAEPTASACADLTDGARAYGVDVADHGAVADLVKQVGEFKNLAPAIKAELPDYFTERANLEIDFIPPDEPESKEGDGTE